MDTSDRSNPVDFCFWFYSSGFILDSFGFMRAQEVGRDRGFAVTYISKSKLDLHDLLILCSSAYVILFFFYFLFLILRLNQYT